MLLSNEIRTIAGRFRRSRKRPGAAPGTLVYEGAKARTEPVRIHVYDFDTERLVERDVEEIGLLSEYRDTSTTTWINVDGVHDVHIVREIGTVFDIHPLTLEDIVSPDQRPKVEEYPTYTYVVVQMMHYDHDNAALKTEQVSVILKEGVVISFQEGIEGDVFDPVRRRLRDGRGQARASKADYLVYALIDLIVDYYMVVLEGLGEHVEALEDDVIADPSPEMMRRITKMRRNVTIMRRSMWPLRDAVLALERSAQPYMSPDVKIFFRDVYDHAVRTVEIIESSREVLATIIDLHVSTLSFRMNEIMKVLAIIATFFLPLTFIAGVYGMNFNPDASPLNMPELNWSYGYPYSLALMLIVAFVMFVYFRRKEWL